MTTSHTWVRRALLGGVALGVVTTGARADELSALKAQLEALQSRVNHLEGDASASGANLTGLPQSDSWITFHRGSAIGWDQSRDTRPGNYMPEDRGFTVAITPTADLPAPVHEVTISGYVKGDFIYDTHQDLGDSFFGSSISGGRDREHVRLHARQSRFLIKSKSQTSIGEVRTWIEGDFFGAGGNELVSNSTALGLRHAWGEWHMTPNTSIRVGQDWTNFMNLFAYPDTVDFFGPTGIPFVRQAQVRVTYRDGPWLFAVSAENPETDITIGSTALATVLTMANGTTTAALGVGCSESGGFNACEANDNIPDFTARAQYDAPGGHKFQISGVLRNLRIDEDVGVGITGSDSELAWGVLGAASLNVADIATLSAVATYGEGIGRYTISGGFGSALLTGTAANPNLRTIEAWSVAAALGFAVTDTTTFNVVLGYFDQTNSDIVAGQIDDLTTVHVNFWWQPVSRFRMGAEGIWGNNDLLGADTEDALRFQLGAEFYF